MTMWHVGGSVPMKLGQVAMQHKFRFTAGWPKFSPAYHSNVKNKLREKEKSFLIKFHKLFIGA